MLGFHSISEFPISTISGVITSTFGETAIYLSSHGITTASNDLPANQHFLGVIKGAPSIDQSITGPGFFGGRAILTTGTITLTNADGALDSELSRFQVDGRRVLIRVAVAERDESGARALALYKKSARFFDGSAYSWRYGERDVQLEMRSNDFLLDVPLTTATYAGTGGAQGGADLQGRVKPMLFGECENISPVLLDEGGTAYHLYQVHDGRVEAISAVYDGGAPLVSGRDYNDATSLIGANTAPSEFDTCLREGLFKLGSEPFQTVTCDVKGDRSNGGYRDTTGAIIRHLVTNVARVDAKLVNGGPFASFEAKQPAPIGIYINGEQPTVAEIINRLCRGVGAFWGFASDGRLRIGRISDPGKRKGETIGTDEIIDIARLNLPYDFPAFRVTVGFRRNWTPDGTVLEGANKKQFRQDAIRLASASDLTIKQRNLLAISPIPIESYFVNRTDAQAEAERLLSIYGEIREMYRVTIKQRGFRKEIGQVIRLQHPRWGLQAGKPVLIVAIKKDAARNQVELTCFGGGPDSNASAPLDQAPIG